MGTEPFNEASTDVLRIGNLLLVDVRGVVAEATIEWVMSLRDTRKA